MAAAPEPTEPGQSRTRPAGELGRNGEDVGAAAAAGGEVLPALAAVGA